MSEPILNKENEDDEQTVEIEKIEAISKDPEEREEQLMRFLSHFSPAALENLARKFEAQYGPVKKCTKGKKK